jgi:aryl-alcohol dehydrogenase-like predicted oxidoreductase
MFICYVFSVESVAKKMNISMAQVATAWSLSKEGRTILDLRLFSLNLGAGVTAPIVGTTSVQNLEELIG